MSSKQYYPEEQATVCLFTDASDHGWAIIVTQVRAWDDEREPTRQAHELLVCQGGVFRGAQTHWSVVEKEAYPVVRACITLDYILEREPGFKAFCDHSNLIQIFSPSEETKKHTRGKLLRWALRISCLRYTIEHVDGDSNVWADIVSRWTSEPEASLRVRAARIEVAQPLSQLRPLQDERFEWPTVSAVRAAQECSKYAHGGCTMSEHRVWLKNGKTWIPPDADELALRLMIVAHCGRRAHRGADTMYQLLHDEFAIDDLRERVQKFVGECLLCKHVKGGGHAHPTTVERDSH